VVDAHTGADLATGTLLFSGSIVEAYGQPGLFFDAPVGVFVLSGTLTDAHGYRELPSGTLVLSGSTTDRKTQQDGVDGKWLFSGKIHSHRHVGVPARVVRGAGTRFVRQWVGRGRAPR
jgi:hypothetical protein